MRNLLFYWEPTCVIQYAIRQRPALEAKAEETLLSP